MTAGTVGMMLMAMKTTWLVLGALLVVGCVGADDEPPIEGVGGTQMQAQGTGGSAPTGVGGSAYVRDPAPTCTDLSTDNMGGTFTKGFPCSYPAYTTNKSGSFCELCGLVHVPAGGCAIRKEMVGSTATHDVFCVDSNDNSCPLCENEPR